MTIEAFENGIYIGECDYQITLNQTVVGQDSIWIVSDINDEIAEKSVFLSYKNSGI